ncbi:MAG TPA: SHOCT domain-containing protein [Pyrinomonadaceae bacterium]|jgi:hypothetical protein|nr:SHOCT domain-containing protein [Pyrinomonadaceae bacterium]
MIFTLLLYFQSNPADTTTGALCCGAIIIFVIAMVIAGNSEAKKQAAALAEARDAYHNSLIKLKANPTSADLRQTALSLGRTYSNLTRSRKGVTVFDEVALMNDINAACAGATVISEKNSTALKPSIEERLEKLAELKSKGLIDDQEYVARKQKILDEV